ncbi:MAG: hypothetical protein DSY55_01380, partial [Clostridia bacterium]
APPTPTPPVQQPAQASPTATPAPAPTSPAITPTVVPTATLAAGQPSTDAPPSFWPFLIPAPISLSYDNAGDEASNPMMDSFVYEVKPGDTLSSLAVEFGRDVRSMACVRTEDEGEITILHPGQNIIIPALSDLCHKVKADDDLYQIAAWYGVTPDDLLNAPENHIPETLALRPGQTLLIPNARSRYRDPGEENLERPQQGDVWWYGDGNFIWPLPENSFWISQRFKPGKHMAIDLAAMPGAPVFAADTGRVIKAGWSEIGYGYRIVIDHGIDYVTLYAHLSAYYVQEGDVVQKGEIIGRVGSTGNATGSHLHFEVRDYGYLIDPLLVLPDQAP